MSIYWLPIIFQHNLKKNKSQEKIMNIWIHPFISNQLHNLLPVEWKTFFLLFITNYLKYFVKEVGV